MDDDLPFSQAAENNRRPILEQLQRLLADVEHVLEIGAGTGQHAVAFAAAMPWLRWLPTEHPKQLPQLVPRCAQVDLDNLEQPVALDIRRGPWPECWPGAVYSANTLHIVDQDTVQSLFHACATRAAPGSRLLIYGPFNYQGRYTSPSNQRFDDWLRARDPDSGIRDFEWIDGLAREAGYELLEDIAMPANNRLICWEWAGSEQASCGIHNDG